MSRDNVCYQRFCFQIMGHKSMAALLSYDDELSGDEAEEYSDISTGKAKHQQGGQQQVFQQHRLE